MTVGTSTGRVGASLAAAAVLALGARPASAATESGELVCAGTWEISLTPAIGLASSATGFKDCPRDPRLLGCSRRRAGGDRRGLRRDRDGDG